MNRTWIRLIEVFWYVAAAANMVLVVCSFVERGSADATVILWAVVCLVSAQLLVLNRKFSEMLDVDRELLSELRTLDRKVSE